MKISQRLALLFFASALVPFSVIGFTLYYLGSSSLNRQIHGEIKSVAQRQSSKLRSLNERNFEVLGLFLEKFSLKSLVREHQVNPSGLLVSRINAIAEEYKSLNSGIRDVTVLDLTGRVITSTDAGLSDRDLSRLEQFKAAKKGLNTSIFEKMSDGIENVLAGPLQIENTTVGYAMLDAGTDNYASVVKDYDELGNTGSTFIARTFADGKMRYLLPLRFDENAAFNEVDSKTVEIINKSNQEDVIDFKDYRGQEVVAAVRGVPQTDWKMVVKIDKAEIFATLNRARNISYVILAITIIAMAGIAWLFSRIITGPISYFTQTVNQIKAGDLSKRVNIKNKDEIGELAGTFNDMTEKMQFAYRSLKQNTIEAQKEKRILQALLDNLPVGVLVVTAPSGEPLMMNRAGQLISGRQAPSGITSQQYTTAYDVLREDGSPYPTEELPLTVTLKTGRTVMKDNIVLRRPDGSTVAVSAISAPIKEADGTFQRAVSVFEDITEKRNLERSRDEFFSIASHELRTPLTAIRGNTDLIQRYFGEKLTDPDLKEMIDDIHESSVRLIEIVNDFLDTSRLEQKRMKFSPAPFDVVTMAEDAIRQYQVTSSRKQILLHVQKPASAMPLVYADQNRCRQVLINLVGNALKFTEKGSVTVSFKTEGDSVKVFVADTGQGIPYDAQSRLFRKFEQAGSTVLTRDSVRGTGLGLYISRMIMEQMKGGIKLESSVPGKGTTFSFTLPAARELTKSPAAPGRGDGLSFTKPLSII